MTGILIFIFILRVVNSHLTVSGKKITLNLEDPTLVVPWRKERAEKEDVY